MGDFIILIIVVPLMAFLGAVFLGTAVGIMYREVLGIDDRVSKWLDRQFGTGMGLRLAKQYRGLQERLAYLVAAGVMASMGYALIRDGVVGLILKI